MSSPVSMQASALSILAQRLAPQHLIKCGITSRRSEAEHIIAMVKEAAATLAIPSPVSAHVENVDVGAPLSGTRK